MCLSAEEIEAGDRQGTAFHATIDLASATGAVVSAQSADATSSPG